jgi:sugar lactone lactonase YvrE
MKRLPINYFVIICLCLITANGFISCSKKATPPPTPPVVTPQPTITSLDVTEGTANTTVVITGTNFSATISDDLVYFNAVQATVTAATTIQLTVTVPANAGTGVVTVKVGGKEATGPTFTYLAALTITSLSVSQGAMNTPVTITGTGFSTVVAHDVVTFNGKSATVTAATSTQLSVTVPVGAGTGNVIVQVDGNKVTGSVFTYQISAVVTTIAIAGNFSLPAGLAFDATGNILVAEEAAGKIQKVTSTGTYSLFVTGFFSPFGLAVDGAGNTYVSDEETDNIYKILPDKTYSVLAGSGTPNFANGKGTAASFNIPKGIAIDANGNLYVADSNNNLIRKITPDGTVSTFAGSGQVGSANGQANQASFNAPFWIAIDGSGNLYVADVFNNSIRKITPSGVVSTVAGSGAAGSADGTGIAATFNQPRAVAVDANGNLYVADFNNGLIRKITSGGVVTTIAGNATPGTTDGIGTAASFRGLSGIIVDASGNLIISDGGGDSLRKLTFQ